MKFIPPRLITPGVIAETLSVPLHRVLHVLRSREHIRPRARAGNLRLYGQESIGAVRQELMAIDSRRMRRINHV